MPGPRQRIERGKGRRTGQNHPRDQIGGDGGTGRNSLWLLLRQRRCHTAVHRSGRSLLPADAAIGHFIAEIWENILLALKWIDVYGDADGDGFVEYARHSHEGLVQQGWKDSNDSVFHADGTLAEAPIALCEVQGYVYEAKLRALRTGSRHGGSGTRPCV